MTPAADDRAFRRRLAALSAVLLLGYLATFSASHFGRVSDGQLMVETAVSLHEYGSLKVLNPEFGRSSGAAPSTYAIYGLGFPLVLQLPLVLSNHLESGLGWRSADVLFPLTNLALNLLTALLLAASARHLGFGQPTPALAALSFAFGSFAWPYISYDFSEPLQAFCLTVAFWALLRAADDASPTSRTGAALAGGALGFGVLTKANLVVTVPVFAFYLWMKTKEAPEERLRLQALFWGPVLAFGAVIAALNQVRFHSVFEFGYGGAAGFSTPLWTGLYGLLLSPNKGLLVYAPITLLLPLGLWSLRARRRNEFLLVATLGVVFVIPIAMWWSWEGGVSWGPRLLYPILPILVLASAGPASRGGTARSASFAALIAGAAVNATGVLFYFGSWSAVIGANRDRIPLEVAGRRQGEYVIEGGRTFVVPFVAASYVPSLSPVRGHAWVVRWRWLGIPFQMAGFPSETPARNLPFGPVTIDFGALSRLCRADRALLRDLKSAQLLLPGAIAGVRDAPALPVRGQAFLQCGLRFLGEKDDAKAYEALARSRRLGVDSPQLLTSLGVACVRLGRISEAIPLFDEYLERVPDAHGARLFYARSLEANGLPERARAQYEKLRELQRDGPHRAEAEERIAALSRGREGP